MDERQPICRVKRIDAKKRIVYGAVYEPFVLDTYGEFMLPEDIETMAYRMMKLVADGRSVVDTNHDEIPTGSYLVESFIARAGDPDFAEGTWCVAVKIEGDALWNKVEAGEINGFSFQAMVKPVEVEIEVEVIRDHVGETEPAEDGHSHALFVQLNEAGRVIGGQTSQDAGHFHVIRHASVTDESDGHSHRYFL